MDESSDDARAMGEGGEVVMGEAVMGEVEMGSGL